MKSWLPTLVIVGSFAITHAGEYASRHDWSFSSGNLVANWSFEEFSTELCADTYENNVGMDPNRFDFHCRYKPLSDQGDPPPLRGNYVLKVMTSGANQFKSAQVSDRIRVEAGANYKSSFHFYMVRNAASSANFPVIRIFDAFGNLLDALEGPSYESVMGDFVGRWMAYPFDFAIPEGADHIKISFVNSLASAGNNGNILYIEDVRIAKQGDGQSDIYEERFYGDALGALDHQIRNDGVTNVVEKAAYNSQRQMTHEYLPLPVHGERQDDFLVSALDLSPVTPDFTNLEAANNSLTESVARTPRGSLPEEIDVHVVVSAPGDFAPLGGAEYEIVPPVSQDGTPLPLILDGVIKDSPEYEQIVQARESQVIGNFSGPFEPAEDFVGLLTAHYGIDNPFSEFAHPNEGTHTTRKSALPGLGYAMGASGDHVDKSGTALLMSDGLPTTPEYNPGTAGEAVPGEYVYAWDRDRQGNYSSSILNPEGRLLKSALGKQATPPPSQEGHYAVTQYGYDSFGRIANVTSPEGFVTTYSFNGMGELVQQLDPDRGAQQFLYDIKGRMRFQKTDEGDFQGYARVYKYDNRDRLVGSGAVPKAQFTQANADDAGFPLDINLAIGYIHDELREEDWLGRTGIPLSELGIAPALLKNTQGKLAASYHRNPESTAPGLGTPLSRLAATFYSYDDRGRLVDVFKFLGPAPAGKQWHRIQYTYDEQDRVTSKAVYVGQGVTTLATMSSFQYDNKDQVVSIRDKTGSELARYAYDFRDQMVESSIAGALEVRRTFDVQGKLTSLRALAKTGTQRDLYSEYLGYEAKPLPDMPDDLASPDLRRFDGSISSIVRKFSPATPNPVEWAQYQYDPTSYLKTVLEFQPTSTMHYQTDGSLKPSALQFPVLPNQVEAFTYDGDFRIISRVQNSTMHTYVYDAANHQLQKVTPDISSERSTSVDGNFTYDLDGNLIGDQGRGQSIVYTSTDRPDRITQNGITHHLLYDEEGYRVAILKAGAGGSVEAKKVYLRGDEQEVLSESEDLGTGWVTKHHLFGLDGVLGFELEGTDTRVLAIRDYLGSVVQNMDASLSSLEDEKGYTPYGKLKKRLTPATTLKLLNESYTGREFDEELGTTYFWARAYDPELGVWTRPDPAEEFSNPYGFVGGNPIHFIDLLGLQSMNIEVKVLGLNPLHRANTNSSFQLPASFHLSSISSLNPRLIIQQSGAVQYATEQHPDFEGKSEGSREFSEGEARVLIDGLLEGMPAGAVAAGSVGMVKAGIKVGPKAVKAIGKAGGRIKAKVRSIIARFKSLFSGNTEGSASVKPKSLGAAARDFKPPSPNQMNKAIQQGKAPKGVKRVDVGKVKGEQTHVHLDDGRALNSDGTWKHGKGSVSNEIAKWLRENGWTPPN